MNFFQMCTIKASYVLADFHVNCTQFETITVLFLTFKLTFKLTLKSDCLFCFTVSFSFPEKKNAIWSKYSGIRE